MRMMFTVACIHAAALLWLAYHPVPVSQQPVLSFTVTLMDLSSSQNTISSAASSVSAPAIAGEPKAIAQETNADTRAAKLKKQVKPVVHSPAKKSSPLTPNAEAQTAVLAPVTPARFDAAYLQNPKPDYPALSRRLGEQGDILLSVYVSEEGRAETVRLKRSSGFTRLDSAALEAVSRWRFTAARQGERLIASWVNVPVRFVLE